MNEIYSNKSLMIVRWDNGAYTHAQSSILCLDENLVESTITYYSQIPPLLQPIFK